ncbi:Uncharacterised protein [Mycobacteroides abscessus subsp. abscessus]|nr:Uncharacterised protein [Mycobacteroides abscessus subsp. abscessus]
MAPDARALSGNGDEVWGSDCDDDDVCSNAVSPREDLTHKILALGAGRHLGSHCSRGFEACLPSARHDACAGANRECAVDEADRASSQNEDTGVGFDGQACCSAQAARERLGEREVRRGDLASNGGDAGERFFGDEDEVGEASIHPGSE